MSGIIGGDPRNFRTTAMAVQILVLQHERDRLEAKHARYILANPPTFEVERLSRLNMHIENYWKELKL